MKFDGAAFKKLEGLNVGILKFFPINKYLKFYSSILSKLQTQ